MKALLLTLIEHIIQLYFYILVLRLIVDIATNDIKRTTFSEVIYLITDPVIRFLGKFFPVRHIHHYEINSGLILLLIFYQFIMVFVLNILNMILI